jgi:hypothetical protein
MTKRTHDQINWARPSADDLDYLRSLSAEEFKALYREMLEAAASSGATADTVEDIWKEALKRATSAA